MENQGFSQKLMTFSMKVSDQRHINAIRIAFYQLMPLILIASMFVLLNNIFWRAGWMVNLLESANLMWLQDLLLDIGDRGYRGTLGIMSLTSAFLVAYQLYRTTVDDKGAVSAGLLSLATLIALFPGAPLIAVGDVSGAVWGVLLFEYTAASGLFVAFINAVITTELFIFLKKRNFGSISLPDSVPPAVAHSFAVLIPSFVTVFFVALIGAVLHGIFSTTLHSIVVVLIQTPLVDSLQTVWGTLLMITLQNLLWSVGINGSFVLGPIAEPTLLIALEQNIQALNTASPLPYIVTKPFLDAFVYMGGGGSTLGLLLALLFFSRRPERRLIGKISALPGVFNINEPLLFGLPVIFNPLFAIPLMISPIVNFLIAFTATTLGILTKTSVLTPWTTPAIISGYLSTGGDLTAAIVSLVILLSSMLVYMPFVLMDNLIKDKKAS